MPLFFANLRRHVFSRRGPNLTKVLIRLRGCEGWSAPLLCANHRRQVFSRRGPNLTKALIRLRGCEGWSAPSLRANHRRQVFSRRGPNLTKALNRLCGCTGCDAPLVFVNPKYRFPRVEARVLVGVFVAFSGHIPIHFSCMRMNSDNLDLRLFYCH